MTWGVIVFIFFLSSLLCLIAWIRPAKNCLTIKSSLRPNRTCNTAVVGGLEPYSGYALHRVGPCWPG